MDLEIQQASEKLIDYFVGLFKDGDGASVNFSRKNSRLLITLSSNINIYAEILPKIKELGGHATLDDCSNLIISMPLFKERGPLDKDD